MEMANTLDGSYQAKYRFTANVSKLEFHSYESPKISLDGVNWRVYLQKWSDIGYNNGVLGVYLVLQSSNSTEFSSCEARAAIFSIAIEPPILTIDLNVDQRYARFHVVVKNVDKLGEFHSFDTVVRGIKWKLLAEKVGDDLSLYLCADENGMDKKWFHKIEVNVQSVSFDDDIAPIKKSLIHELRCGRSSCGFQKFIGWTDFMDADKKYVEDNAAFFLVELEVSDPEPLFEITDSEL